MSALPKVLIGYPSLDTMVNPNFANDLALLLPMATEVAELTLRNERGSTLVHLREQLARDAAENGYQYLLFLDSDMRFPPWTLHQLLKAGEPIVGVNYARKKSPFTPTANALDGTPLYTLEESTGLEEVLSLGFGAILIASEVFRSIEHPWFVMPWVAPAGHPEQGEHMGEDVFFARKAREAGFMLYVDHDLSKEIGHDGVMTFTYKHSLAALRKAGVQAKAPSLIEVPNGS